jgi:hypothetical protein
MVTVAPVCAVVKPAAPPKKLEARRATTVQYVTLRHMDRGLIAFLLFL